MNKEHAGTMTWSESLLGSQELAAHQSTNIKKTYMLLSASVAAAVVGGYLGSTNDTIIRFFSGWMGWIAAMLLLNGLPYVAMATRHNPILGTIALIGDGFVAGLVLAPILFMASVKSADIVPATMILTGAIFVCVTGVVMVTQARYSAPRNLIVGIFVSIVGVMILNMFLNIGLLGMLISGAIGIFGVILLVHATSEVLNNPEYNEPVMGSLMLFAGIFNIFVALLYLLLAFGGGDD
jgi:modulator of FtsH protease